MLDADIVRRRAWSDDDNAKSLQTRVINQPHEPGRNSPRPSGKTDKLLPHIDVPAIGRVEANASSGWHCPEAPRKTVRDAVLVCGPQSSAAGDPGSAVQVDRPSRMACIHPVGVAYGLAEADGYVHIFGVQKLERLTHHAINVCPAEQMVRPVEETFVPPKLLFSCVL